MKSFTNIIMFFFSCGPRRGLQILNISIFIRIFKFRHRHNLVSSSAIYSISHIATPLFENRFISHTNFYGEKPIWSHTFYVFAIIFTLINTEIKKNYVFSKKTYLSHMLFSKKERRKPHLFFGQKANYKPWLIYGTWP